MTSINGFTESRTTDMPVLSPPGQTSAASRMAACIFHDLRQPLTAILANAEFLTRPDLSDIDRNEFFQDIRWGVDRINTLFSSLLKDFRGGAPLTQAARNIVHTVKCAVRMITVRCEFRRISVTHRHKGMTVGWFDAARLERVIANLALNACEAVDPASGEIVITTFGGTDSLQIRVWDNGPGISPSIRESLFQSPVSYGKTRGSGLGLVIAKALVEDHGGTIHLDEKCERGTSFAISIPFVNANKR